MLKFTLPLLLLLGLAGSAMAQAPDARELSVKLNYTGAGTVDAQHRILVMIFDSAEFTSGTVPPVQMKFASAKDATVTFSSIAASTVWVAAVYDPAGKYDASEGPPPTGSSIGIYAKTPGQPEAVKLEAEKKTEIVLAFGDEFKMP